MAEKRAWLYIDGDWDKLIGFCQKEKDHAKRLEFFNEYLNIDGDHLTIKDVYENWRVFREDEIAEVAEEFFSDYNVLDYYNVIFSYWFFNIYTGEMRHVDYTVKLICSGVVGD